MISASDPAAVSLLAIVVPAYKARFLAEALASIAAQTDQRFCLYVCDDGSPENLETVFRAADLPAARSEFHRFEENVGGRSVVESWRRSITRTVEPWVWMFSDDDVMDPGCVAAFYHALAADGETCNVYRFNTLIIDGDGRVLRINPPHPEHESVEEFIYHRLTEQRLGFAPEHIFRRAAYEARGGFVDFPFALGSDDATWINLAGEDTPLRGVNGPRVCWRLSGVNISAFSSDRLDKRLGLLAYARWLYRRSGAEKLGTVDGRPTVFDRRTLVRRWFLNHLRRCGSFFGPREMVTLVRETSRQLDVARWLVGLSLLAADLRFVVRRILRLLTERSRRSTPTP